MAAGITSNKRSSDSSNLDVTIGILQRCLELTTPRSLDDKNSDNIPIEEAVPESSKWAHCQHMISQDETKNDNSSSAIRIIPYKDESQIADIMRLITKELSEPYSIYTYRYFLHNWPELCYLAYDDSRNSYVGCVLCKLDKDRGRSKGYIAMLAVDESCRRMGLGTRLVKNAIQAMQVEGCDEVSLETEVSNKNAQRLYSNIGFIREKRLIRYYLNGGDAFHLKLYFNTRVLEPRRSIVSDDSD